MVFFEEEYYAIQQSNPNNKVVDIDDINKDLDEIDDIDEADLNENN